MIKSNKNILINDIRKMIEDARNSVAVTVNAGITRLYWQIGKRVNNEILKGKRADYGMQIVATLSRQLTDEYGKSFSEKNLRGMKQFYEVFNNEEIVVSLIRQLSWTHLIAIIPLKDPLKREFYAGMCRIEKWSVRTLRNKIDSMLYERTVISKKPEKLAKMELEKLQKEEKINPNLVIQDSY